MTTYNFCQRRDGQVFAIREGPNGVTGALGPLTEEDVERLTNTNLLPDLNYDMQPWAVAWFRAQPGEWGLSLHRWRSEA